VNNNQSDHQLKNTKLFKSADTVIVLSAIIFTLWLYTIFWFGNATSGDAGILTIQITDNSPRQYSLDQDRIIKVEGAIGQSLIEIRQKKVRFVHSPCRSQFCILHGWISSNGDITACLPNQVSIRLQGNQFQDFQTQHPHSHFDAISGIPVSGKPISGKQASGKIK